MKAREIDHGRTVFLLLLLAVFSLSPLKGIPGLSDSEMPSCDEKEFVQITGDVIQPGVYGFSRPPDLESLLIRCGGPVLRNGHVLFPGGRLYRSGAKLEMLAGEEGPLINEHEMSAFYKITLGIPVSLNRESSEGLTALPGIGRSIAAAIVSERARKGGFDRLDDLLTVPGIGSVLYKRLGSYLVL